MDEENIYLFNGEEYTVDQVTAAAASFNMSLDDYVNQYGIEVNAKTEAAGMGATVGPPQNAPVSSDSRPGIFSSEFAETIKSGGPQVASAPEVTAPVEPPKPVFAEKPKPVKAIADVETDKRRDYYALEETNDEISCLIEEQGYNNLSNVNTHRFLNMTAKAENVWENTVRGIIDRSMDEPLKEEYFSGGFDAIEENERQALEKAKQEITAIILEPVTEEELEQINEAVEKLEYPVVRVPATGMMAGASGYGSSSYEDKTQPGTPAFHEYHEAAKEALKSNGVESWTPDQLDDVARALMRSELMQAAYMKKMKAVGNYIQDNYSEWGEGTDSNWFADFWSSVESFMIGANSMPGPLPGEISEKQQRYYDARLALMNYAKEVNDELAKANATELLGISVSEQSIELLKQDIEGLTSYVNDQAAKLQEAQSAVNSGQQLSREQIDAYNAIYEDYVSAFKLRNAKITQAQDIFDIYKKQVDSYSQHQVPTATAENTAELVAQSYEGWDVFGARTEAWLLSTVSGVVTLAEGLVVDVLTEQVEEGVLNSKILRDKYDTPAEMLENYKNRRLEKHSKYIRAPQKISEVETWGDFIDATIDMAPEAFGQILLMGTVGKGSIFIMGASAGGQKMEEMYGDMYRGKEISPAQFYGTALLYSGAEIGTEYISFRIYNRSLNSLKGAWSVGAVGTAEINQAWFNALGTGLKNWGINIGEEAFGEGLNQVVQNMTDITVLGNTQRQWYDDVDEAALKGGLMSGLFFSAPGMVSTTVKMFNTRSEQSIVAANHMRGLEIQKQQAEINKKLNEFAGLSQEEKLKNKEYQKLVKQMDMLNEEQHDLYKASMAVAYTGLERLENMTTAEIAEVLSLGRKISPLRMQMQALFNKLKSEGKTNEEITQTKEWQELSGALSVLEEQLYDITGETDVQAKRDKENAINAIEEYSLNNNGIPTYVLDSSKKEDWKKDHAKFAESKEVYDYYEENFGKEVADYVTSQKGIKDIQREIQAEIENEDSTGSALRGNYTLRLPSGTEVTVPIPRVLINKTNAFRHETGHLTLFDKVSKSPQVMMQMSQSLNELVDNLFEQDPFKYGALKRFRDLRRNSYVLAAIDQIQALQKEISTLKSQPQTFRTRQKIREANQKLDGLKYVIAEENVIAVSDFMAVNNIDINKVAGRSIMSSVRSILGMNPSKININNGSDVIRFLHTFNKQFDQGKTSRTFKQLAKGNLFDAETTQKLKDASKNTASLVNNIVNSLKGVSQRAKQSAEKVNKLYEEQGTDAVWEIGEVYRPMIEKIFTRKGFDALPNFQFQKEDLISEILYGKTGIYGLVNSYNPDKAPAGIAAYINSLLEKRVIGIVNKMFGEQAKFYQDVTEVSVAAEETSSESSFEEADMTQTEEQKQEELRSRVRVLLGLTEEQMNRVKGSVLTNLLFNPDIDAVQKWVPSEFLSNLNAGFERDLFSLLKGEDGMFPSTNAEWFEFAEGMYDMLVEEIPLKSWLRSKVKIFYKVKLDPVTNKPVRLNAEQSDLAKVADPKAGNKVYEKVTPTKEEFMSWIKAEGMSWTTVGTRKDLLARLLVRHMAFDATMEVLQNGLQERYDPLTGKPTGKTVDIFESWRFRTGLEYNEAQVTAKVALIINRNPDMLFNLKSNKSTTDIAAAVAERVNEKIKAKLESVGAQGDIIQQMQDAEGDVSAQKKLAEQYAEAIIEVFAEFSDQGILDSRSVSKALVMQIVDDLVGEFEHVTPEAESYKAVYRAAMEAAAKKYQSILEPENKKRRKEAQDALKEQQNKVKAGISEADQKRSKLSNTWNTLMQKIFPNKVPKEDIDALTAQSIYGNKPWWKKFQSLMHPKSEDFAGLLYWTLGKGKLGEQMMQFYTENILEPFNRASSLHDSARVQILSGLKELNKAFKPLYKQFDKVIYTNKQGKTYTLEDAIKLRLFEEFGYDVPDIQQVDRVKLLELSSKIPNLIVYTSQVKNLFKKSQGSFFELVKPQAKSKDGNIEGWTQIPLSAYVYSTINGDVRDHFMKEFSDNVDAVFNEFNMNRLEALFGKQYVESLQANISSMKSGKSNNRVMNPKARRFYNWAYVGPIANIMFVNFRSALLQLVSTSNYINWTDNNPMRVAKQLANPRKFAEAFVELMNSDFMVTRRDSGRIDIDVASVEEFIRMGKGAKAYKQMVKFGYLMTKLADSTAILMGGTTMYLNRVETYMKEGMSEAKAKEKAFNDFREITETNQQSARQDKLSPEQRHVWTRIILAFGNTSAQYSRIMLKAAKDLKNGRGDAKTNISKILYYGAIQNIIFTLLQQGIFRFWLDDDDDEPGYEQFKNSKEFERTMSSLRGNILRGFGVRGVAIETFINTASKINEVYLDPDYKLTYGKSRVFEVLKEASRVAPAISYKVRKLGDLDYHYSVMQKIKEEQGTYVDKNSLEFLATAVEFGTNIPLSRVLTKFENIQSAYEEDYHILLRVANAMGWPEWQVDPEGAKKERDDAKQARKATSKESPEQKRDNLRNDSAPQEKPKKQGKEKLTQEQKREKLRNAKVGR